MVASILGILGMVLLSLHWMSRSRNLQAHKVAFNEIGRSMAEGGYQFLSRAVREGSETPDESELSRWLLSKGSLPLGFYGHFLQSPLTNSSAGQGPTLKLSHGEIMELIPEKFERILHHFETSTPGSKIEFQMEWSSTQLFEENVLMDPIEKTVNLTIRSKCTFQGTEKVVTGTRKLRIYNLLAPLLSKFTFYHKSQTGGLYNQLLTNLFGRPVIRPDGKFKYPANHFPLVLVNGPLSPESKIIPDSQLLGGRGQSDDPQNFEYLTDDSQIQLSKEQILRRGFLYFGPHRPDSANVLNLTPGADPNGYGEYFFLFNPYFGSGPRTYPAIQRVGLPEAFQEPVLIQNLMEPTDGLPFESSGKADIYSLHEGFYESDPTNSFAPNPRGAGYIKDGYTEASSLIHPFGTYTMPSRAYTVGSAFRAVAKLSSIGIDRDESSSDESQQSSCLGRPSPLRDATAAFLYQTNRSGFENPIPNVTIDPIHHTLDNRNYAPNCSEPRRIRLPDDFDYPLLFPDFDTYLPHMCNILYIPRNHMVDYPHYSHRKIPPTGHDNFKSFMFPPFEPESLYLLAEPPREEWLIKDGSIHGPETYYLKGEPDEFDPDTWQQRKISFDFIDIEDMMNHGFLEEAGDHYVLDSRGHQLSIITDFKLDKPLQVINHTNLFVHGPCSLPPIDSDFYVHISCAKITLKKDSRKGNLGIFRAFLDSRSTLGKENLDLEMNILGGISMHSLDFSIFQAPNLVTYNTDYSPLEPGRDYLYRILIDDHTQGWGIEI